MKSEIRRLKNPKFVADSRPTGRGEAEAETIPQDIPSRADVSKVVQTEGLVFKQK
jgi:hypothetical protein